ncbi:hypothetical protein CAEBREN_04922 [Caenorhabditis brenneri]|uniref:RING-type domain-containing protein n=1 Tax=Caenorhabditis brenneri TaxID=135651 RepID=G0N7Y6_CAEBE|nr:hypothetical protein CAEBREN_04922 [Caenorhabditis brenneri]
MPYGRNKRLVSILSITLLLVLIGLNIFSVMRKPEHLTELLIFQTYYTLFIGSSIDLCVHWMYGVTYPQRRDLVPKVTTPSEPTEVVTLMSSSDARSTTNNLQRQTHTVDLVKVSPSSSAPECQVCFEHYSEQKIPRILTSCGHSVCQDCAKQIMGSQNNIICPHCWKVTVVNGNPGTVENLPRNHALL